MRYQTSRNGQGHLVVHDVPIFVECKRGDTHFNAEWLTAAVERALAAEAEGYMPPLHIRHHGEDTPAEPAGFFRITKLAPITFKGDEIQAIYADLVVTQPWVEDDVLSMRLPYRSVEIFNVDIPAINSLALLNHEPPYLELPMLMVEQPGDPAGAGEPGLSVPTSEQLVRLADARIANPWRADGYSAAEPVVACFRHGNAAHFFTQDTETMTIDSKFAYGEEDGDKQAEEKANPFDKPEEAAATEEDDGDEIPVDEGAEEAAEAMEGSMSDEVKALCETIKSGTITVADLEMLKQAIIDQMNGAAGGAEEQPEEQAAVPAPTPGEAMSDEKKQDAAENMKAAADVTKFAAMQGELDALKAKDAERDAKDQRRDDVADALQRLEGKPLGADLEGKLVAFHAEHGGAAFKSYVDSMCDTFAAIGEESGDKSAAFAADKSKAPEAALAYTELGQEAVEKAAMFAAQHKQLAERGFTRHSEEAFVRSNMTRAGFKVPAAK